MASWLIPGRGWSILVICGYSCLTMYKYNISVIMFAITSATNLGYADFLFSNLIYHMICQWKCMVCIGQSFDNNYV